MSWWSKIELFNYLKLEPDECEYIAIAPIEDLKNGERMFLDIDGLPIVLFKIGNQLFAIGDICSHDDGPLGEGQVSEYEVTCPRHGASFDIRSGKALSLPAIVDIPAYPTQILDGQIYVGVPR